MSQDLERDIFRVIQRRQQVFAKIGVLSMSLAAVLVLLSFVFQWPLFFAIIPIAMTGPFVVNVATARCPHCQRLLHRSFAGILRPLVRCAYCGFPRWQFVVGKRIGQDREVYFAPWLLLAIDNHRNETRTIRNHGHRGSGGMGDAYQASDSKLGRNVAVKFLPKELARDANRVAWFEREACVLASLNRLNIAAIYGLEHSGDQNFLTMELVGGETPADRIQRGALRLDEAVGQFLFEVSRLRQFQPKESATSATGLRSARGSAREYTWGFAEQSGSAERIADRLFAYSPPVLDAATDGDLPFHHVSIDSSRVLRVADGERYFVATQLSVYDRISSESAAQVLKFLRYAQTALWHLPRSLYLRRHNPQKRPAPSLAIV
jgi:hypothetical protein